MPSVRTDRRESLTAATGSVLGGSNITRTNSNTGVGPTPREWKSTETAGQSRGLWTDLGLSGAQELEGNK